MPPPAELQPIEDPIIQVYANAWQKLQARFNSLTPAQARQRARLIELQRSVERSMDDLDDYAGKWIRTQFSKSYAAGAVAGEPSIGELIWTQIHQEAVEELAQDLFQDLLKSTHGVKESSKALIRTAAKEGALAANLEGRTAVQAAKDFRRAMESQGIWSVVYKDGSRHGLAEYSQVVVRTKTAVAYNTGTLNQHADTKFFQCIDGPQCGWSFHQDPTLARGLIVTRDEAASAPISHPNCRRVFGPRPDVTSKQGAPPLGPSAAQTHAQEQADAARRATQARRRAKTSKTAKKGPTNGLPSPTGGLPSPAPDVLDSVIDATKFEAPKKAFPPGVKNRGYARAEHVPSVTDLIDVGWHPPDAIVEQERLFKNAKNVERRARKKLKAEGGGVDVVDASPLPNETLLPPGQIEPHYQQLIDAHDPDNIKILSDERNFGQVWWERLGTANTDGYIPIRNLTVDGYKVKYGIAVRRNGRNYLLEVADDAHVSLSSLPELEKHIQTMEQTLVGIGPPNSDLQKALAVLKGSNPDDVVWAARYNMPGFKSAATGGKGRTVFWGTEPRPGLILHEFGHNLDDAFGGISVRDVRWDQAVRDHAPDYHSTHSFQSSILGHEVTPGFNRGITTYGQANKQEDFAESVRLYMADRHKGFFGYSETADGVQISVRFADVFPEKAAFLDDLFGFTPVGNTPFVLKQRELAVKAYVDSGGKLDLLGVAEKYGLSKTDSIDVVMKEGPTALAKKIADEAAIKAAKDAAELGNKLNYKDLTFSDKTSVGLKKSNAYKKALKEGKSEVEAKQVGQAVYDRELEAKLQALAKERGLTRSAAVPTAGPGLMRPDFNTNRNLEAGKFIKGAGQSPHRLAQAQGGVASQAKANIAAELASRLGSESDLAALRQFLGFDAAHHLPAPQLTLDGVCSELIQRWAGSSGDSHPTSLVLQMAMKEEFGLTGEVFVRDVTESIKTQTRARYVRERAFLRKFVRAMYEHTQEELAKQGISEISVYRGMNFYNGTPHWAVIGNRARAELQPANSFSSSKSVSKRFGSTIFSGTIPRERIIGTARTGFGCRNELEFVIMDSDGLLSVGS